MGKRRRHHKSTVCRIREICDITREHYEEGNQSKCYHAIWRKYVAPRYGICYHTYLRYIGEPLVKEREPDDPKQLRLFD
jgi:hypothetical protein